MALSMYRILKMASSGLLEHFRKKHPIESICTQKDPGVFNAHRITLQEMAGIFIVLGSGIGVSFVVFFIEGITYRVTKRSQAQVLK